MLTKKNLERLAVNCKYDPERIGIAVLRFLGCKIETFTYSDSLYVYKNNRLVYHKHRPDWN